MNKTTWSQGRQEESNDKYKVSWTYHPDKGLEVMYEFNGDYAALAKGSSTTL